MKLPTIVGAKRVGVIDTNARGHFNENSASSIELSKIKIDSKSPDGCFRKLKQ